MSSLIPHDYRYKISSPTPVDKEPLEFISLSSYRYFITPSNFTGTFDNKKKEPQMWFQ